MSWDTRSWGFGQLAQLHQEPVPSSFCFPRCQWNLIEQNDDPESFFLISCSLSGKKNYCLAKEKLVILRSCRNVESFPQGRTKLDGKGREERGNAHRPCWGQSRNWKELLKAGRKGKAERILELLLVQKWAQKEECRYRAVNVEGGSYGNVGWRRAIPAGAFATSSLLCGFLFKLDPGEEFSCTIPPSWVWEVFSFIAIC